MIGREIIRQEIGKPHGIKTEKPAFPEKRAPVKVKKPGNRP